MVCGITVNGIGDLLIFGMMDPTVVFPLDHLEFSGIMRIVRNVMKDGSKMNLTPENPWIFIENTNADDFLKEVLKLGKPTEVSIVGAFGKEGRGSTQDIGLPLHFDGEYSARKAAEKGLTFDKKIDILALYCLKDGDTITVLEWNGNIANIILKAGQALIIDNKICRHGRIGKVGDRMLLRIWIERN
jgi:uncharacterized membrane protein